MALNIPKVNFPRGASSRAVKFVWLFGSLFLVLMISYNSCTTYVRPGEAGVKQSQFGKGIEDRIYGTGLHYVGAGETLHRFPTALEILELTDSSTESSVDHRTAGAINIQTSEGYSVRVDATVLYRIKDPLRVMKKLGPGNRYEDAVVIPRSIAALRAALGELDAEDFYRGDKRVQKQTQAKVALSKELAENGIEVVEVLIRRYVYDIRYQAAIEGRKIQDQSVFKNEAEAKAATATAAMNKIVAEGAAAVQVELARGEAEVKKLAAEADLYRRKKAAEGDLLVKLAEAQGVELESQALRGTGSENMVGLRMAEALRGTRVIVLPTDGEGGMNPLDLKGMLKRFDVKGE
jgi:regulator of protease activity HflC (stomatin/prohibitin superfamily)